MLDVNKTDNFYLKRDSLDQLFDSKRQEIAYNRMSMGEILAFLSELNSLLAVHEYTNDKSYFEAGRKNYLKEKIIEYLSKDDISENDIYESLYHLMEIASNDYSGAYQSIVEELKLPLKEVLRMDDEYRNKGIVCLQEKDLLLDLSQRIMKKIKEVFLDINYFFELNGFKKIKDDKKRIVIRMKGEEFSYPYETNVVYNIQNTDISFTIVDDGNRFFFINKSYHVPVPEGFESPLRTSYTGLIPDYFSLSYAFNNPIKVKTDDNIELDISIE